MSERIALHEAAHAVVAEELGFRPTTIELTQGGAGMCYVGDSTAVSTLPRLRRELVVLFAGHVAEYIDSGSDLASLPVQCVLALECSPRTNRWARTAGQRWRSFTATLWNCTAAPTILSPGRRVPLARSRTAGRGRGCCRDPQAQMGLRPFACGAADRGTRRRRVRGANGG
jgi:hypothetical protein